MGGINMFKHLFTPMKIGNVEIPNRTVVPAMVTNFCNPDGTATERYVTYHETKAKGEWGLIITEDYAVDPKGRGFSNVAGLWNDHQIESHSELPRRIHQYKSKIFAQIYHAGRQTSKRVIGTQPVAPSPIPCPVNKEIPHELTITEIHEIVEQFGDTALRAKKAGFDGIEIHGAHGYLVAEFMSSYSNKRTDSYGGCLANRLRFPLEIINNIRRKVGPDFPICFRISADEFVPGGRTLEETKAIAIILESAGIDVIHVSGGVYASVDKFIPPAAVKRGNMVHFAAEVKKVVNIPVITVSRINDPLLAESILSSGFADFVGMARGSLADPALPKKAKEGRIREINYCVGCMQGCSKFLFVDQPIKCMVNPTLGREREFAIQPAEKKQKVLIAGGGPAGMEAAIVAARAGHDVHLYEAGERLGGQLYLASIPPAKGELASFTNWQINQLQQLGVKIYLNTIVTPELVETEKPDAVIVATGGNPIIPNIPGFDGQNVVNAFDVLSGKKNVAENIVVIGGGLVGAETADYLANHGKKVTIVEMLPEVAQDCEPAPKLYLLQDLKDKNVTMFVNTKVKEIRNNGVAVINGQEEMFIPADSVVLAVGSQSVNHLTSQLEGKIDHVITIGDAVSIRHALEAIEEGYEAGLKIRNIGTVPVFS